MATASVRPFAPTSQRAGCTTRHARFIRVALPVVASAKGFGEPKKEQAKRTEQAPEAVEVPRAAPPRARAYRETPQVVVDRMFRRILIFTGIPVFTGMALFPLFYWLRVVQDIEYPLWIVYIAQVLTFGGGLVGITYGALSASWDPSREGSALGFTEVQANLSILLNRDKRQQ
ncbi:hypothetical protein GPECTOR_6g826 [Gonium pectorale]|uniref:Protein PAM68, chloroplastic n=1 Tax=Gonium pectorale TaxID=33097 RepID=A0A150GW32_GONPE|nr:hypothetical protein GPECTOR_6g826 [Gonium pectorale]|eukprot:KXZ53908.1 hypothetical protein GPECTOR_6g826 [Gonium pectorale]